MFSDRSPKDKSYWLFLPRMMFLLILLGSWNIKPLLALEITDSCPSVANTPRFTIVYGNVLLNGTAAPIGTVVEARNPRSNVVGCFEVTSMGAFGAMYVFGEDMTVTPSIPGMRSGEVVAFYVDGALAASTPVLTWSNDQDLHQINLAATLVQAAPAAVTDLTIEKSGNNALLSWTAVTVDEDGNPTTIDHYNIYRATTPSLTAIPPYFIGTSTSNDYTDLGILGLPNNYYYLITAVDDQNQSSGRSNRVGKFSITVYPEWNLLAWPLIPTDTSLDTVLGADLFGTEDPQTADRVLVWNGITQSYDSAWFCGGPICQSWGSLYFNHWLTNLYEPSPLTLEPDTGFWIHNRSGNIETLVLVGSVSEIPRVVHIGQNWQMVGSAFPSNRSLDAANIPATGTSDPITADRVWYWNSLEQSYASAWFCGGSVCASWGSNYYQHWLNNDYSQSDIVLFPGHGFWYQNKHTELTWSNPLP